MNTWRFSYTTAWSRLVKRIQRQSLRLCFRETAGRRSGEMACTTSITTTQPRMRCWALRLEVYGRADLLEGNATLVLGGENGKQVEVQAGDIMLLPTGTGHCELKATSEFLVVGAYPPGQHWDICRSAPSPAANERMRNLPFPNSDPVFGSGGPMTKIWESK